MNVLVACEESQAVCKAFRAKGHIAFSCDTEPCSGGHPEWHIQKDVLSILHHPWDLVIAFPPCTDIAVSGSRHFEKKRADGRQQAGIDFFMEFTKLECSWAIENPIGVMSSVYRKPDQIINPYQFGNDASKATCLWLNKLRPLSINKDLYVSPRTVCTLCGAVQTLPTHVGISLISGCIKCSGKVLRRWGNQTDSGQNKLYLSPDRAKKRSVTYAGIAQAMADQWS